MCGQIINWIQITQKTRLETGWSGDFGGVNGWIRLLYGKHTDCSENRVHKQIN